MPPFPASCNLNADKTGELYLLQIRPIVDSKQVLDTDLQAIGDESCLLRSHNSLGHGISEDVATAASSLSLTRAM